MAILDADKEGFLRSRTSLIQTMGRAARNIQGEVILYADTITKSMKAAIEEIDRRRAYQEAYNKKHHITAVSIHKPIRGKIIDASEIAAVEHGKKNYIGLIDEIKSESMTPYDRKRIIKKLEVEMRRLADDMQFEAAIAVREKIRELKG